MSDQPEVQKQLERAFGAESRAQLLNEYFEKAGTITAANAWLHVYRLLLWTDRTTGLVHCYESDKTQPGRPWYARSLAFHDWLAKSFECEPHELGGEIDWLFRRGTERLAAVIAKQNISRATKAAQQRAPYADRGFPEPGEDPALQKLIEDTLAPWLTGPPADALRTLTQRIQTYFGQENKRKNLVGEGFEDVLSALIDRVHGAQSLQIGARTLLHTLPGFRPPRGNEKTRKVDVSVIDGEERRTLISAKWSVRADREEQFGTDFATYTRLEDAGRDFDFVLITNEFDAARLVAACDLRGQNTNIFASVVHVNPLGPLAAYGTELRHSARRLGEHVESGRLTSLESWLSSLIR